jgi:organic radical activating enzyme
VPEPRPAGNGPFLLVAETFGDKNPTFQGEGPSCGTPAVFIRLSRCNLACSWCDTKYTWDWAHYDPRKESARLAVAALAEWALSMRPGLVVITGGEPLLQQLKLALLVPRLLALVRAAMGDCGGEGHLWVTEDISRDPADSDNVLISQRLTCADCPAQERVITLHHPQPTPGEARQ